MAQTEVILNLAWMLVCIGALGAQVWLDRLRSGSWSRSIRLRRTLSVLIAALALFPVISASDDRIRLADLGGAAPAQQTAYNNGQFHHLLPAAPLEDPEHGQTPEPVLLTAIVCLFLVTLRESSVVPRWFSVRAWGRAPPQFA